MKFKITRKEFLYFLLIGLIIFLMPLILTQSSSGISFEDTGEIGDTIGGITAPFLAFFAAILVYLAFKAQIDANEEIKKQFEEQRLNENQNFAYTKFKERIYLINNDIDNFEVAFHKGKMISKLEDLHSPSGKKYNFGGIQGMNLFLIEYFRDKAEHEKNNTKVFKYDNAFHSVMLNIMNLVVLFYNTHLGIKTAEILDANYKVELEELLTYTFQSKISFVVELYFNNYSTINVNNQYSKKFKEIIDSLRSDYFLSNK